MLNNLLVRLVFNLRKGIFIFFKSCYMLIHAATCSAPYGVHDNDLYNPINYNDNFKCINALGIDPFKRYRKLNKSQK